MTFAEFKYEWGEGDDANIPFALHGGTLWIFQPRKEVVYAIYITTADANKKKLKAIVNKGLKAMKALTEAE